MAISIKELLDSLAEDSRNNNLKQWCEQLYVYYKENDRNSYAEITEYIFSNKGGIEYVRELLPLLKDIRNASAADPIHKTGTTEKIPPFALNKVKSGIFLRSASSSVCRRHPASPADLSCKIQVRCNIFRVACHINAHAPQGLFISFAQDRRAVSLAAGQASQHLRRFLGTWICFCRN